MHFCLETLNQAGQWLPGLAWSILWQSSLLMVVLFAADFLLARKIRAAVRYALWLVVLVKLLLPPTLALPTGAAWWLLPANPAAPSALLAKQSVSYPSSTSTTDLVSPAIQPVASSPSQLTGAGWWLLVMSSVSLGLLLWMLFRWWQVTQKVRHAATGEAFAETLAEAHQLAGTHANVTLKLVTAPMSPAVCGLFRPVILLPQTLTDTLSPTQLRAVVLHEIIHLRRRDVWVNCAQALLQIVYWWHPLLWFANARIRSLREEAVDDAVMLALREDAETYAPTLLAVARLAYERPRLSLGLIGILESRSALRQRIERLLDFQAPRRAGLTLVSLCGILAFSATALPMGEAPEPAAPLAVVQNTESLAQPTNNPTIMDASAGRAKNIQLITGRSAISKMLASVRVDQIAYDHTPLSAVLAGLSKKLAASGGPQVNFLIDGNYFPDQTVALEDVTVSIQNTLTNLTLLDALDAIALCSSKPLKYSVTDYAVVFSWRNQSSTVLFTRGYKLDRTKLLAATGLGTNASPSEIGKALLQFLAAAGVDVVALETYHKSLFYDDRSNRLFVRATQPELDLVEKALRKLYPRLPQYHIGAKFMVVPESFFAAAAPGTWPEDSTVGPFILTATETSKRLKQLQSQPGVVTLGRPEAVTTSGRQMIMKAVTEITIVTNAVAAPGGASGTNSITFQSTPVETGPILDLTTYVLDDGYTLKLLVNKASVTEFKGYQKPSNTRSFLANINPWSHDTNGPVVLPVLHTQQAAAQAKIWDQQTLVLLLKPKPDSFNSSDENIAPNSIPDAASSLSNIDTTKSRILVFITATIIDSVGNRVHTDADMPFAKDKVPPQH